MWLCLILASETDGKLPEDKDFCSWRRTGPPFSHRRNLPAQAYGQAMSKLGEVGKLSLLIKDPTGNPISTARVDFSMNGKSEKPIPAYPDADGLVELLLPTGEWKFSIKDNGRESTGSTLHVKKEGIAQKEISMGVQSGIHFNVTKEDGSPSPCKAQVIGVEGTQSPRLGPVDRAHGCVDQFHSENGTFSIGLPPGKYKIIITRESSMTTLKID